MWSEFSETKRGLIVASGAISLVLLSALGLWGAQGFLVCLFIIAIAVGIGASIYAAEGD